MSDKIITIKQTDTGDRLLPKTVKEAILDLEIDQTFDGESPNPQSGIAIAGVGFLTEHQDISGKANVGDLSTVAFTGSYSDLSNKPVIPSAQVQSDWSESDITSKAYILNKPSHVVTSVNNVQPDVGGNVTIQVGGLPSQSGHAGDVLTTDGTDASWADTTTVYPVVETYINNGSWCKIYAPDSTGYRWCEMGGLYWNGSTMASTDNTITFLKNFKDTAYSFSAFPLHQDANINSYSMYEKYTLRTVSSTVLRIVGAVFGYEWIAKGYIVNEV